MSEIASTEREERARELCEAVQPHLSGDEVEAVGEFERPDAWWYGSDGGALVASLIYLIRAPFVKDVKGRLGKLPRLFLLAVTEDKAYAFSYRVRIRHSKLEVKEKLAAFDRGCVSFSKEMGTWSEVAVLELMEDGEKKRIQVKGDVLNAKKNPCAAHLVAELNKR